MVEEGSCWERYLTASYPIPRFAPVTRTTRSDIVVVIVVGGGGKLRRWMSCIELHDEVTSIYTLPERTGYDVRENDRRPRPRWR